MLKGYLIILLFTGQTYLKPFDYNSTRLWFPTDDEKIVACSERAEELREQLSTHSWNDPRGQGWYLKDGTGTFQGHIC